VITFLRTL